MTIPFLATLSARARQAYPIIQGGVAQGLSSRAITETLVAADRSIRRSTLLDIIRRVRDVETRGAQLRNLRLDRFPDPRRMPEALTQLKRAFSFRVELRGVEIDTGIPFTRHVNVALDRPLTRERMERIAEQFIEDEPERYGIDLTSVLLVSGMKAGPEGTHFDQIAA